MSAMLQSHFHGFPTSLMELMALLCLSTLGEMWERLLLDKSIDSSSLRTSKNWNDNSEVIERLLAARFKLVMFLVLLNTLGGRKPTLHLLKSRERNLDNCGGSRFPVGRTCRGFPESRSSSRSG
uniref:Uncharacterized protein n=1 Tax=Cacopsylla melanoneura TaxID=428564 RepID=A0A8D8TQU1_9HEMI